MKLDQILRYGILAGVFIIPFIPFYVASSMFFPYITGKNFAFRIIVELIFAMWGILAIWRTEYRPRFSWLHVSMGVFLIIIFIADLFGVNFFQSFWSNFERMEGYITLLHLGMYFLVMSTMLSTEKLWDAWFMTTLGASAVMSFMALLPVMKALGNYSARIDATFGNPIYLAIYNAFHIYIALHLWSKVKNGRAIHWLYGIVIIFNGIAMFYTQTRGTVLGFIGGILVTAVLIALFEREHKLMRRVACAVLATIVIITGGFFAVRNTEFVKTTGVLNRFASITLQSLQHDTFGTRMKIWNMAIQGAKERPILGWGQNNFDYVFSKYYTPDMYGQEPWFDRTHDVIFDWLVAGGFLGLVSYFSILTVAFYYLWLHRRTEHPMNVTERSLWTGLLVGYTVHNLVVFDNITSYILYFTVLAYIIWRVTGTYEPVCITKVVSEKTVHTVALPVALVLVVVVVYYANIRGIETSAYLIQGLSAQQEEGIIKNLEFFKKALAYDHIGRQEVREQLVQAAVQVAGAQVSQDIKDQFYVLTEKEMTKEVNRNPDSARLRLFMGTFYGRFGKNDEAFAQLEKAKELTPKKQIVYFQLGDMYLRTKQYDKAFESFKYAYDLDHSYEEAFKLYVLAALYDGKNELADSLLNKQYGTIIIDDDRFIVGYNNVGRFHDAIQIINLRISKDPTNPQIQVQLAATYFEAGEKDQAIKTLQDLLMAQPQYKKQLDGFIADIKAGRRPGSSAQE